MLKTLVDPTIGKAMQYSQLGSSGIQVSRVCLGTMTWGFQNNQQDADQQLDYALGKGINFVDTAEMYAVPPSADTYGKTETIIGNYLAGQPGKRQDMVLASKIAGPGLSYIRGGRAITGESVKLDPVTNSVYLPLVKYAHRALTQTQS